MAKGNAFMGQLRGKLGDVVFTRQNGVQVSRARNRQPANPKTEGQVIQRLLISTIAYAYSGLKSIVDHSFEGRKYGQECMSEFMSRNLSLIRGDAAKVNNNEHPVWRYAIKGIRTTYPNKYVVSTGSLAPVKASVVSATGSTGSYNGFDFPGAAVTGTESLTLATLMDLMGANAGDQFTFIAINANEVADPLYQGYGDSESQIYPMNVAVRRIKFKDSYLSTELALEVSNPNFVKVAFDSEVTDQDLVINLTASGDAGQRVYDLNVQWSSLSGEEDTLHFLAGGCIRSRKENGQWLRSNTSLDFSNIMEDAYLGATFANAFEDWMAGGTAIGASSYILNSKPNTGMFDVDLNP